MLGTWYLGFWVVRDLNSGRVVAVGSSETRTGSDLVELLWGGGEVLVVKEVLRDGGPRYNILSNLGVPYSHVMFGG